MIEIIAPPPQPPDFSPDRWLELAFPEDGFKIKMPAEPTRSSHEIIAAGEKRAFTLFRYFGSKSQIMHSVSYADFAQNIESPHIVNKVFDAMRERVINQAGGIATYRIISEEDLIFENHPARLLQVEVDHKAILRAKFFAVGNRLYQVIVITMSLGGVSKDMRTLHEKIAFSFLDSFELIQVKEEYLFID